jgi:aminoglycoside phosphotransferase (APT) family kinase protein
VAAGAHPPPAPAHPRAGGDGSPGCGYPWPWSVYRWLEGDPAATSPVADPSQFAADLADFLAALYQVDSRGGPVGGQHSCFRGGPVAVWDAQAREAIATLNGEIDAGRAVEVWEAALGAAWHGPPVWVHGDVSPANLLVDHGRLSAVIDFGCSAVGDPACDTVIAWTFLTGDSRRIFQARLPVDDATWARGRGWALWKAMITLVRSLNEDPEDVPGTMRVIADVLAEHEEAS